MQLNVYFIYYNLTYITLIRTLFGVVCLLGVV